MSDRFPPKELTLHIHKDGHSASTWCPSDDCLFGRRITYVLAQELATLQSSLELYKVQQDLLREEIAGLKGKLEAAVEYTVHRDGCGFFLGKCECGLEALLAQLRGSEGMR